MKFFKDEDVIASKDILISSVDKIVEKLLPHYAKRKGENRGKMSVDDMFNIFSLLDENGLLSKLQFFVASDLSKTNGKPQDIDGLMTVSKMGIIDDKIYQHSSRK